MVPSLVPPPAARALAVRLLLAAAALPLLGAADRPRGLPAIVFASRQPLDAAGGGIPGLGPWHRASRPGGRLLLREPGGRIREILPPGSLHDVADPSVSPDARRVAFAGLAHPDSAWRIYVAPLAGGPAAPATSGPASSGDDLDPCWIDARTLCFASTRGAWTAEYADLPATNLWTVRDDGAELRRLTAERNGAEEPAFDPLAGRIVYARWWFNRHRAARDPARSITADPARAAAADSVNLWQAVEIDREGRGLRLAMGGFGARLAGMAYQPAVLAGGGRCGVYAGNLGLSPAPAGTGVQWFPRRYGESVRVLGAVVAERSGDPYGEARGLAPASACAPAGLPDGRLICSYDPGGRGDFGIVAVAPGSERIVPVVDLPGTLELDAAAVVPWPPAARAAAAPAAAAARAGTFVYDCLNLFAQGAVDGPLPGAPGFAAGLVLRVFAARADGTVEAIREVPVAADGSVRIEDLPADTPLFEQLVDPARGVVMAAHGPAHVAGFNWGAGGSTSRCAGCHLGHSTLLDPAAAPSPDGADRRAAAWFNAAPAARVTGSGSGAAAAVDRWTRGGPGWVAAERRGVLRLEWPAEIELRELALHPPRGPGARAARCEARGFRGGAEIGAPLRVSSGGGVARLAAGRRRIDRLEIVVDSGADGSPAGLAEVEVIARLAPEVLGRR